MPSARSSTLLETDLTRIKRWVEKANNRIPPHAREEVRIEAEVDDRSVTIRRSRTGGPITAFDGSRTDQDGENGMLASDSVRPMRP